MKRNSWNWTVCGPVAAGRRERERYGFSTATLITIGYMTIKDYYVWAWLMCNWGNSPLLGSRPSWGPQFLWWVKRRAGIPSGKQPHNYGTSLFWMGKSTISMAIFHSYVAVYQRVHDLLRVAVPPWKRHRGTIWMFVSNNMKAVISQLKVGLPKANSQS